MGPASPGDAGPMVVPNYPALAQARIARKTAIRSMPPPPLRLMPVTKKPVSEKKDDGEAKKPIDPLKDPAATKNPANKEVPREAIDRLDELLAQAQKLGSDPHTTPGRVVLTPGSTAKQQVCYAGAVRVLLTHPKRPKSATQPAGTDTTYDLFVAAMGEPRLLAFALTGAPTVTRAIDEHGQSLTAITDSPAPVPPGMNPAPIQIGGSDLDLFMPATVLAESRGVTIRLQSGAKPATRLKELSGTLSAQLLLPNSRLATIDDVSKSAGKTADIKGGGRLSVDSFDKAPEAEFGPAAYRLVYKHNNSNGPLGDGNPELLDAKGQRLTPINGPSFNPEQDAEGQVVRVTVTAVYRREKTQGEPVRMVLTGTYVPTIVVPFRFVDVPLR
jgi:hypothetical protein